MSQNMTLSTREFLITLAVVVACTLLTAMGLYFLTEVSPETILLSSAAAPGAAILLLWIYWLVRTKPAATPYLKPLRLLGLVSVALGVTVLIDLNLAEKTVQGPLESKITRNDKSLLHISNLQIATDWAYAAKLYDGQAMKVKVTPIFQEVRWMSPMDDSNWQYSMPRANWFWRVLLAVLMLVPATLLAVKINPEDPQHNILVYVFSIAPSFVISAVSVGLWLRLLAGWIS